MHLSLEVQSLYIEANEPSLNNRRIKLAVQYEVKLKAKALNSAYNCLFETHDESVYEARPNYIWPRRLGIKPHLEALSIDLDVLDDAKISEHPLWLLNKPSVIF